mgnify:CR=1 FL=1
MRLDLLLADVLRLARRHGLVLYIDFLLANIAVTLINTLIHPQRMRDQLSGISQVETLGDIAALLILDPASHLGSAVFTVVSAFSFLRIWWLENGRAPPPELRHALFWGNILPLIVLQAAADVATGLGLALFVLPAAPVIAMTMFLIPAAIAEGQGWQALGRAWRLAAPQALLLSALWLSILVPWIALTVIAQPSDAGFQSASDLTVAMALVFSDFHMPAFAALGLLFTLAAYRQLARA